MELFQAQVSRVRDLTHDVREIDLRLIAPKMIAFKAGQFLSFEVSRQGQPGTVTRPYSIASPPSRLEVVTIVLNRVPGGPGSTYLFSLREGDRTQFKGPAGTFYLREDFPRDRLFVATGTGIAPIRSMLLDWSHRGSLRSATLYWGLRSQRDLYYQDELEALAKAHQNFSFMATLSRPENGWQGPSGRVTRLVEEGIASVKHLAVYLCGNGGMIKDVSAILNGKGLCPIYREKYYDGAGEEDRDP
ncbi:MAG: FAD-binding oxidoreductase [Nitrospiraceae bacterium]